MEEVNDIYPESIDLKTLSEERRCYWSVVLLEQHPDFSGSGKLDRLPGFLDDVHLFEKVNLVIMNPQHLHEQFADTLMDLNNAYVRAKNDHDFINEFPINIYFASVANYAKFYHTHLNKLRHIFPRVHIDGK